YMYILVTHWNDHWDCLGNRETRYPNKMIRTNPAQLQENMESIFIKVDGAKRIQKGWRGSVHNIKSRNETTFFTITIDQELDRSDLHEYDRLPEGWHVKSSGESLAENQHENDLLPSFFTKLERTEDHSEFEDLVYKLL